MIGGEGHIRRVWRHFDASGDPNPASAKLTPECGPDRFAFELRFRADPREQSVGIVAARQGGARSNPARSLRIVPKLWRLEVGRNPTSSSEGGSSEHLGLAVSSLPSRLTSVTRTKPRAEIKTS